MELLSVSVELVKEAATDVLKETAETAESLNELGKVGNEVATEQIRFGKLDTDEYGKQIELDSEETLNNTAVAEEYDALLEPQISFQGGLAACNWKCISSYCYPPNLAKGISTKNPHSPNSRIGHS